MIYRQAQVFYLYGGEIPFPESMRTFFNPNPVTGCYAILLVQPGTSVNAAHWKNLSAFNQPVTIVLDFFDIGTWQNPPGTNNQLATIALRFK
jgi:hypothetical protein